ncbi:shikimate kinase [Nosocomiicoccus ampullae]|uniref:shikimate kinase n=1 Tax=Nosocomiicoccus ampullae TaxID=489910 RepID=UPI001C5D7FB9|nr:shikimate kinase [Nosocomiicoccus ampullae]QYA49229.1 shikimate kinase [Nosocomiicoccus ampullae]
MILIGFMGVGKTTIALKLAEVGNKNFVDLDDLIEKNKNKSIPNIFKDEGEAAFRRYEYEALKEAVRNDIVATGGGIVEYPPSLDFLKQTSKTVIFLNADFDTLYKRIKNDTNRPNAIKSYEELKKLYDKRNKYYTSVADIVINNDDELNEVIHKILHLEI